MIYIFYGHFDKKTKKVVCSLIVGSSALIDAIEVLLFVGLSSEYHSNCVYHGVLFNVDFLIVEQMPSRC